MKTGHGMLQAVFVAQQLLVRLPGSAARSNTLCISLQTLPTKVISLSPMYRWHNFAPCVLPR